MFVKHTNGWKFVLRDGIWGLPGVEDITEAAKAGRALDAYLLSGVRTYAAMSREPQAVPPHQRLSHAL